LAINPDKKSKIILKRQININTINTGGQGFESKVILEK